MLSIQYICVQQTHSIYIILVDYEQQQPKKNFLGQWQNNWTEKHNHN